MPVTLSDGQITALRSKLDASSGAHQAHDAALSAKATADAAAATADANEQAALKAEQDADADLIGTFDAFTALPVEAPPEPQAAPADSTPAAGTPAPADASTALPPPPATT